MFTDTSFHKFSIDEENKQIGKIEVNEELIKNNHFIRPFIRKNEKRTITKYGNRNYEELDQYIIACLNEYYNRLLAAPIEERNKMLAIYNRLYGMWQELHNYKISKNLEEMDKMYDIFSYELYLLGYIN